MKLRLGLLAPLILLAGCGLPPAVIVASYAVDGLSYMASGKSVTDRAFSALTQRDCALHRVITEAGFCRDSGVDGANGVAVAAVVPPGDNDLNGLEIAPKRLQPRWGPVTASLPPGGDRDPPVEAVISENTYLVLASFSYWVNGDRFVGQYPALAPEVVAAWVDGEVVYRVVTVAGVNAVDAAGITQPWPLRLCRDIEDVLAACAPNPVADPVANPVAREINVAALSR